MIRENRYAIIKWKDAECLTFAEIDDLKHILWKITDYRERRGKGKAPFQCVVVESDWPEYEVVWNMIEKRVDNETNK